MDKIKKKIIGFLKLNYSYFLAPLLVFVIFGVAQACFGIYPFGKAIMASYDLLAQICPFLEHIFAVLDGTSGVFHTFFTGRGMDVFGSVVFCAVSPFTFLLLLAGRTKAVFMVSIVLPLKVACASISAVWLAKKYFKNIPEFFVGVFGVLYALGGYLYVANTYINWVDLIIYMPLLVSGFIKFARGKGIRTLSIILALCIYTCFSISCFSFFLIFPIGIAFVFMMAQKEERLKKSAEFAVAFAIAVGIALPILIPSFLSYLKAGRNTGMFSSIFYTDVTDLEPIYKKFAYILCDGAFIFLSVIYFIRRFKFEKEAKFLLVALIIALFPNVIDESMLLLNFGSYYSYALRFGFLTGILFYYIALREANFIFAEREEGEKLQNIFSFVKKYIARIFSTGALVLLVLGSTYGLVEFFNYILNGTFEDGAPFHSYFPVFAHSEGGIEGTSVLFGVVAVISLTAFLLAKFKLVSRRNAAIAMSAIAMVGASFNCFALVKGDKQSASYDNIMRYAEIEEKLEEINEDYFRIKSYDYYISADSPLIARYYTGGVFSSTADRKNLYLPNLFKYKGNGNNSTKTNGGGVFGDAVMDYKYVVIKNSDKDKALKNYYVDTGIKVGSYLVYENTLAFPLASLVKGEDMNFEGINAVEMIGKIYSYLSSGEEGLEELPLTFTELEDGTLKVSYTVKSNSEYWSWNDFPEEMNISFKSSSSKISSYSAYAYLESGGRRVLYLKSDNGPLKKEDVENHFHVSQITRDNIEKLKEKLEAKKVNYRLVKNGIEFPDKIIAEKGEKLFLSYVDIDGYFAYVNGKKVEIEKNDGQFIIIPLDEGENSVELKYVSPYPKFVLIGILAGGAIVAIILLVKKKYKKAYAVMEKPIGVAAIVLGGLLVLFFMAFPFGVHIWKAFKIL